MSDDLRALSDAATPGPWSQSTHRWDGTPEHRGRWTWELTAPNDGMHPLNVIKVRSAEHAADQCCWPPTEADAAFIVALVNAWRAHEAGITQDPISKAIIAQASRELDEERAENARLRTAVEGNAKLLTNSARLRAAVEKVCVKWEAIGLPLGQDVADEFRAALADATAITSSRDAAAEHARPAPSAALAGDDQ